MNIPWSPCAADDRWCHSPEESQEESLYPFGFNPADPGPLISLQSPPPRATAPVYWRWTHRTLHCRTPARHSCCITVLNQSFVKDSNCKWAMRYICWSGEADSTAGQKYFTDTFILSNIQRDTDEFALYGGFAFRTIPLRLHFIDSSGSPSCSVNVNTPGYSQGVA